MSGGSYNYAYHRVADMAAEMEQRLVDEPPSDPEVRALRERFASHLRDIANAMRMVEWVDSYDCSPGDEAAAIRVVLDLGADAEIA